MYIAHISEDRTRKQSILEHLCGTARHAQAFAAAFGCGEYGHCIGMLHDIGKYSAQFQKKIIEQTNDRVNHSTAGAQLVWKLCESLNARIASYCVAGHHGGLPDGGSAADVESESTLSARLRRHPDHYHVFRKEIDANQLLPTQEPPLHIFGEMGFTVSFFIRMLYSCLVDADFIDTEDFMSNGSVVRDPGEAISVLHDKLQKRLKKFDNPQNDLNRMRCKILARCQQMAVADRGLFTLTVPTGGGKTLSSLAFALAHAQAGQNQMRRVIYVIPYTSIIEQTAKEFREILGDRNVLEHHYNFQYDSKHDEMNPHRLASENWDKPVVVTTNVQFFESFFANKSSRCRKLHNVAGSVIIFDEAQMLPREYLLPCIRAISELVHNYGCTAVLCTATQPALQTLFPPEIQAQEIMEDVPALYSFFKRTEIRQLGPLSNEALIERLDELEQVLCIVNRKSHARFLYEALKDENTFCLTTLLFPLHRTQTLEEIRRRLKDGLPCRVLATSLVEAGVDVDFPTVYRAEAGLDSEIQAAGRCNREGRRPAEESIVYVFQPEQAFQNDRSDFLIPRGATQSVLKEYEDVSTPEAIAYYFRSLYKHFGSHLDSKAIVTRLEEGAKNSFLFPFRQIAKEFRLIEVATKTVLIPVEENSALAAYLRDDERDTENRRSRPPATLAACLRRGERSQKLMREITPYCVSIYETEYDKLVSHSALDILDDEIAILTDLSFYDGKTGLSLPVCKGGIGIHV